MTINKETQIGKIEVVGEYKIVQVAMDTLIKEDGNLISQTRHRHALTPDADISNEHSEVQAVCNTAWTQEVKDAWNTFKQEQEDLGA